MFVIYQNEKSGMYKSEKDKYTPCGQELQKLISQLLNDGGMLCFKIESNYIHFDFKNGKTFKLEDDTKNKTGWIRKPYNTDDILSIYLKHCRTSR